MKRRTLRALGVVALVIAMLATSVALPATADEHAQQTACGLEYKVKAGDWLSRIAATYLGDPTAYPAIVAATNKRHETDPTFAEITNPDLIEIGWKICVPSPADTTPLIPREVLFGNPDKAQVQLSPDGTRISYRAPVDGVMNVWVGPADDPSAAEPVTNDTDRGIRSYGWTYSNEHILYLQDQAGNENWRVYSVNLNTGEIIDLTPLEGVQARIQAFSPKFPNEFIVALNDRVPQLHDLYRVNVDTGDRTLVLENEGFLGFVIDDEFVVRFVGRMTPDGGLEYLSAAEEGGWEPFMQIPMEDLVTTSLLWFDEAGTILYMIDSRDRNTSGLFALDLATGEQTLIAENPVADVSDVMIHPTQRHIQAVAFTYERKGWQVLDESIAGDLAYLSTVADGDAEVTVRTLDDRYWMVAYVVDNGPVRYYRYDRQAQEAQFLFTPRRELEGLPLAKMHPVVIESRDGLNLVSYYTLPVGSDSDGDGHPDETLPMVLYVHGGPWGRDNWGYNPMHQWLANRGYAVLSVNFRASTGFGKAFINAANLEWGAKMHDDLLDAVDWAIQEGIADPEQVAIMGGSYGGYATLVGLTFTPDEFACGVDIVGISNLVTWMETIPAYWAPQIELFATRIGDHRTEDGRAFLTERSPLTYVDRIQRPLLIGQGANDPRVNQAESDQIVQAMQEKGIPATYVVYPDEGHGFARPENSLSFFAVAEAFLSECLGGRYEPIGDDFEGSSITVPGGAEEVPGLTEALSALPPRPTSVPSPAPPALGEYVPTFEEAACPFGIPSGHVEGETVECGYLVVPENRMDPNSRNIRLAVAIFRHPDGAPEPDPIIYLEGGPGGSPLKTKAPSFDAVFGPIFAANRDIILFDQRGVGFSEPALDCPTFTEVYLDLLDHEVDGQLLTSEEILARKVEAFRTCAEELSAVADLSAYNTLANAADVNHLRLALGYDKVNLYGSSYGTRLALGVMRDFPEGVRSAVLDAPYGPEVDIYLATPGSFDRALNVLIGECTADDACNAAFPDLRTVLFDTVERLNQSPASIEVFHPVTREGYTKLLDGDGLVELVFRSLYDTAMRPVLPRAIYDAANGTFTSFLPTAMLDILRQDIRSWGMYFSVLCNEEIPFSTWEEFEAVVAEYPEFAGFFAGFEVGGLSYAVCPGWGAGQSEARENEPVRSDIPTLIMTGEYDPIVPPGWGKRASETLANSYFFEFAGMGHGVSFAHCPRSMMLAFLDDPSSAPDAACIGEMEVPPFDVPMEAADIELEPFTSEELAISGAVPMGWTEVQLGIFARASSAVDMAVLLLDVVSMSAEDFLDTVAEQYGLAESPESTGAREANELTWSLYTFEVQGISRDLGLAGTEESTFVVLMRSAPSERSALYEAVFLPVVDALAPLSEEG